MGQDLDCQTILVQIADLSIGVYNIRFCGHSFSCLFGRSFFGAPQQVGMSLENELCKTFRINWTFLENLFLMGSWSLADSWKTRPQLLMKNSLLPRIVGPASVAADVLRLLEALVERHPHNETWDPLERRPVEAVWKAQTAHDGVMFSDGHVSSSRKYTVYRLIVDAACSGRPIVTVGLCSVQSPDQGMTLMTWNPRCVSWLWRPLVVYFWIGKRSNKRFP